MTPWRIPYSKFGDGPGLVRVAAVAARLGIELPRFGDAGAVIVGSNGKGSTAAMTAAMLTQSGAGVGLFTSPHLLDLNERFRVDGDDIADHELNHHWRRVQTAVEAAGFSDALGGFEFLFLIAADWFTARGCAHTIWEAGIGGRLDPVRLIEARRVALTSLDLEHTDVLGSTLEEIAREKIDAAPDGASLFVGASCLPLAEVIQTYAATRGVQVRFVEALSAQFGVPMPGVHQRENAALALCLARHIAPLDDASAARGLGATRWPGRLETIDDNPPTIVDVGHTPDGVRAALAGFEAMHHAGSSVLVCGASRDKNGAAMITTLAAAFPTIVCASARHKGASAAEIASYASAANPAAEIILSESVADARRIAVARARTTGGAVYVAGGLFLAAEFKAMNLGRDPASLHFF